MMKTLAVTAAMALACLAAPHIRADDAAVEAISRRQERLAWWREARFGLFLHWGPVSLEGTEISWSRANSNPACPNKGPIPVEVYDNLYKHFNPTRFDAARWVAIARAAGAKYMVLTAKHCDGFCLWDSRTTDYNITHSPFRRDICAELATVARREGVRIGWYYSPMDWRDPDCRTGRNARHVASMQEQLRELLTRYGRIDLLWFDTDGMSAPWDQEHTYALVRWLQPRIVINNRLDMGSQRDYDAQAIGPQADYYTPEQRVGGFDDQRPWETCMTLGTQWSWKPNDRIKTVKECVQILARCGGGDGNLLLDVGPMPSGEIEPRQVEVLHGIGAWLRCCGDSIYGTRGGPYKPTPSLVSTHKGNVVYIHVLRWDGGQITLPALPRKVEVGSVVSGGAVQVAQTETGLTLIVAPTDRDESDTVIKLILDGPADTIAPRTATGEPLP
jgi:alpha-L-fucosidase